MEYPKTPNNETRCIIEKNIYYGTRYDEDPNNLWKYLQLLAECVSDVDAAKIFADWGNFGDPMYKKLLELQVKEYISLPEKEILDPVPGPGGVIGNGNRFYPRKTIRSRDRRKSKKTRRVD